MTSPPKTVLITGATGKQGSAVISALLAAAPTSPFKIIALTRDAKSRGALNLASNANITIIEGDLSNPNAIFSQAGPIWGVYSVQVNSPAEEQQGKALIDAAVAHGVQHFVYSSGDRGGLERSEVDPTNVKNFAAKFNIEKHLEVAAAKSRQKMTYTILRPVTFFENQTADIHGTGFARMWQQMGDKKLQMVSTKDIGWFGANAFLHPDKHCNIALTLVGDELTQPEADVIFTDLVGTSMAMAPCLVGSALKWAMKSTLGDMFQWFKEVGYGGNVDECRKMYPAMQDYRTWLLESSQFAKVAQERQKELRLRYEG
jgi:uncharacterized protein YbjT (DUF2867 family)